MFHKLCKQVGLGKKRKVQHGFCSADASYVMKLKSESEKLSRWFVCHAIERQLNCEIFSWYYLKLKYSADTI